MDSALVTVGNGICYLVAYATN